MAFKRALWRSGYTYRRQCEYCGVDLYYQDSQLDFRPWYPDGFVYCPACRRPLRHNEIFATFPDGTPVYRTQQEADTAIPVGYYQAMGIAPPPSAATPVASAPPAPPETVACPSCGRVCRKGYDRFCSGCGRALEG